MICSDPSLNGSKWSQTIPAKYAPSIIKPLDPINVGVKHSGMFHSLLRAMTEASLEQSIFFVSQLSASSVITTEL